MVETYNYWLQKRAIIKKIKFRNFQLKKSQGQIPTTENWSPKYS